MINQSQKIWAQNLIPTLNGYGYVFNQPDLYSRLFLDHIKSDKISLLDIGAAYGNTSLLALKKGAKVFANDLDIRHLNILLNFTPKKFKNNLTLLPGDIKDLDIPLNKFNAVLASGVLHYIQAHSIQNVFDKIYNSLKIGGRFFYFHSSPFVGAFNKNLTSYIEKRKKNIEWPGEIKNFWQMMPEFKNFLPNYVNLLDIEMVHDILLKSNSQVLKLEYVSMDRYPNQIKSHGKEYVGAIVEK